MVRPEIIERQNEIKQTPMLERIESMREMLRAAGDEAQELRHLPAWAAKEMAANGLYRFALPAELGGEDVSAREQIENVELVSSIDGSVGWCAHINSEINGLIVRRMDRALCDEIFGDWEALVCSGLGPPNGPNPGRTARREGDGWRLSYQGSFASGCHNATWNFVMSPVVIDEATEEGAENSFMVPKGEFEVVDTWDTAGMRGSGSHDVRMDGTYVPPEHLLPARPLAPSEQWDNPTFRNPCHAVYNKSAVALGVCKGAIESFTDLAMNKVPWGLATALKDMPQVHYRIGEAMATYMAARTFVLDTQDAMEAHLEWKKPSEGGRLEPEWDVFWPAYLACAHSAQAVRHVVGIINNTAGTTGSRMESPLERHLRDAQQSATHALISWRHYEDVGKTFVGHDPAANYMELRRA